MAKDIRAAGKCIFTFALILVMAVAMAVPAIAYPNQDKPWAEGSEENPADVAITKVLSMPVGTNTPDGITFTFDITPVDYNGMSDSTDRMPPAFTRTITFNAADDETNEFPTEGSRTLRKQVNVFQDDISFDTAGIYHFGVTEKMTQAPEDIGYIIDPDTEALLLDTHVYDLYAYVANNENKDGVYLWGVVAQRSDDLGKPGIPGTPGTPGEPAASKKGEDSTLKVDATPGKYGMIFTNEFTRQHGPTGEDPKESDGLTVTKNVEGKSASHEVFFDYVLNVIKPVQQINLTVYRAYIMYKGPAGELQNAIKTKEDAAAHGISGYDGGENSLYGRYVHVPLGGSDFKFKLKDGESLVFTDIHVGASYKLKEEGKTLWKASYAAQINGEMQPTITQDAAGDAATVKDKDENTKIYVCEGINGVYFLNEYIIKPPMALNVNDLPFVISVVASFGILAGAAAVCYHKKMAFSRKAAAAKK